MSDYKDDLSTYKTICEEVASGELLVRACEKVGKYPKWFYRFLSNNINNQEICQLSAHARAQKTHYLFDKCESILIDLENKKIDCGTARILFDSYLRLAGKANPQFFSDRPVKEVIRYLPNDKPIDIEEIKKIKRMLEGDSE